MTDERMRAALRAELESIPLPERFQSPAQLVSKPLRARRRRGWVGAAAAVACLVLLFLLSPAGAWAARLVSSLVLSPFHVMTSTLQSVPPDGTPDLSTLKPGDSIQVPGNEVLDGRRQIRVTRTMTLADLQREQPDWQFPTYLPPLPQTVVYLHANEASDDRQLTFSYQVTLSNGQRGNVSYFYTRLAEPREEPMIRIAAETSHVSFVDGIKVRTEQVNLRSELATAYSTDDGQSWNILWVSAWGHGGMSASLPLDELVRIIESIPTL